MTIARPITFTLFTLSLACITCVSAAPKKGAPAGPSYYKEGPLLLPAPKFNDRKDWNVKTFGPVGIGINLKKPDLRMEVANVEPGSPADKTGKLKKGQVIESINGKVLKDIDPRQILGDIITEAEAKDGVVSLKIKDVGNVVVKIPVMGSYSDTWPVDCPKSDKIVRNLANLLSKQEKPKWGSALFLLSTGEDADLAVVEKWMKEKKTLGTYPWFAGYHGIAVCEYYLRTGDKTVLPLIKEASENLFTLLYNGGWSGRGHAAFGYMGGGHMHAAGVHCLTFLLLAKYCGVDVNEYMLQKVLKTFYRFSGHGNVAYGDQLPEGGYRDNGKTGGLAVAMAAAARLTPDGENSVYAGARDNCGMKSFYATNWFHAAHTGGGIGEIWHHAAISLVREKRPTPYRSYLDTRRWVMELSRRWDGGIGIGGVTDGYDAAAGDNTDKTWGTYFALTYTYPRKKLQLFGAPKTDWCKQYKLPDRPWGRPADDIFNSLEPVPPAPAKALLNETVETHASLGAMQRIGKPDASEDLLWKYLHHHDFGLRSGTMRVVIDREMDGLVVKALKSEDPRLRHAGILAITGMFKGRALPAERVTPEMFDLVGKMIDDPNEALWVVMDAMKAIKRANPAVVGKHRDTMIKLLKNDDWYVQSAAVEALTIISTDPAHYKAVLPPVLETLASSTSASAFSPVRDLAAKLKSAKPEVKAFAKPLVQKAYTSVPTEIRGPGGKVTSGQAQSVRNNIATLMASLPGGDDFVKKLPRKTSAYVKSGNKKDLYEFKSFVPNKKIAGKWAWAIWPRPKTEKDLPAAAAKWVKSAEKQIADYEKLPAGQKRGRNAKRLWKDTLELVDGGTVKGSSYFKGYFWSGNMLVGINSDVARKMEVRSFGGKDFLIIESGDFDANDASSAYDKQYTFYMRIK